MAAQASWPQASASDGKMCRSAIAIQALTGGNPAQETLLTPETFPTGDSAGLDALYNPDEQPGWSTYVVIEPYTHYEPEQVSACKGPGE